MHDEYTDPEADALRREQPESETAAESAGGRPAPWRSPRLLALGSVAALTRAGGSNPADLTGQGPMS